MSPQHTQQPFRISASYLVAVALIYAVTACAWLFLGRVTDSRTEEKDSSLRSEVGRLWGGHHNHIAPNLSVEALPSPAVAASQPACGTTEPPPPPLDPACRAQVNLEPSRTRASVDLRLQHRRKGLLWYSTYAVLFDGSYQFHNDSTCPRDAHLVLPFPASGVAYDEFQVQLDGAELPVQIDRGENGATTAAARVGLRPGARRLVRVRYLSRGMDLWRYSFGSRAARARDFELTVRSDFDKVDFPGGSLSPTHKQPRQGGGWNLTWRFGNLLSDAGIGVALPQKINPGPLASEISKFAPVSLAFFFFLMLLVSVLKQVRLHPVHYAMLAAAFFSFHLLLVYSVDLMPLGVAFAIASTVSVALVVSYLRLAVGPRFALLWAGCGQLLYLVLFSLAFFLQGYTGITITVFSILTLFAVMQLTGRIDWSTAFGRSPLSQLPPGAAPPRGTSTTEPEEAPRVFSRVS